MKQTKRSIPTQGCAFGQLSLERRTLTASPCPVGTEVPSSWQPMTLGSFGPHPESVFQKPVVSRN